ncbi:MAG: kelch repeat-containing protein [Lentisphaeria bacterium]|nr:kelch repeat-containing protein [Lentisphaeria bacterium]
MQALGDELPASDLNIAFVVSEDVDRDIQQPQAISGLRILAVGRGNAVGGAPQSLERSGSSLKWAGGAAVDVGAGGLFTLNPGRDDYLLVEVAQVGGAGSEELPVYSAEGRAITALLHISGLEIMSVSDMVPQGYYQFNYDGAGSISWGSGSPVNVLAGDGPYLVYGDGLQAGNYVVLRRTGAPLPAQALSDSVFVNQTQLLRVEVDLNNVRDFSPTHITAVDDSPQSGISLWWDANADGKFNAGDMFVQLLEKPELIGSAGRYKCVLTPDPAWLSAWLSCPQDSSYSSRGSNFFVCVNTTVDMSYGDQFSVSARFYEPTEPDYESGGYCFASGSSSTVTCTSITNTVYKKLTYAGQTVDADKTVGLVSVNHFLGADLGSPVYMTDVKLDIYGVSNFDPEKALADMEAEQPSERGVLLFVDSNDNGVFDAGVDKVISCHINIEHVPGSNKWTYSLMPENINEDVYVPGTSDSKADHFIAVRLSEKLPFGSSFYASMGEDYITYNTGPGNAASSIRSDNLSSTISSKYQDLLDASLVSDTIGLSVNAVGAAVGSDYHKVRFAYDPNSGKYSLNWNGYSVEIDISKVGSYTIGDEESGNFITVTFDPLTFFREDTVVASPSGRAPADISLGAPLYSLAGNAGLRYFDANANGKYDRGETIVYNGSQRLYGSAESSLAQSAFDAADGLAFYSEDGSGEFVCDDESDFDTIFFDSDGVYTLPWMALTVDSDNYVSAGAGTAPGISSGSRLVSADEVSLAAGEELTASQLFLYFIKAEEDGLGYRHGEDIVVARRKADITGTVMSALELLAGDRIVFDPAYVLLEDKSEYESPGAGAELHAFEAEDYLRFKEDSAGGKGYAQGQPLFLSYNEYYEAPSFEWIIRVNKERAIRRYNPAAMQPYNSAESALSAVIGLDLANSGANDIMLTSLTLRFRNVSNFSTSDLRELSTGIDSGVQLWRDIDGNGVFNPHIDKLVGLSKAPSWNNDGSYNYLSFSPNADNEISNPEIDGLYDFFVVLQPSEQANSKLHVDKGDSFQIIINNSDVVLNKTLNKSATISTGVIYIDSKPPQMNAEALLFDSDQDGYLERVQMSFHEALQPGLFEDLSIWQLEDAQTGADLTVTKASLSADYKTLSLELSGYQGGSGQLRLKAAYNEKAAMLDWAGNPVELRLDAKVPEAESMSSNYLLSSDSVPPRILHGGMAHSRADYNPDRVVKGSGFYYRDRNGNGHWDEGENIWFGEAQFGDESLKVWSGGKTTGSVAWNTVKGYAGKVLDNIYYCDENRNGAWERNEFLWIDLSEEDEVQYDASSVIVPLNRTEEIALLDTDGDGRLDALRVEFSEYLLDASMLGYKADMDYFAASRWVLAGPYGALQAWRQGLDGVDYKDSLNNNLLYFSFEPGSLPDSGNIPQLAVNGGETLTDLAGNRLNGGSAYGAGVLKLSDQARPVLLEVNASSKVVKNDEDKFILEAGASLSLVFSEKMKKYSSSDDAATLLDGFAVDLGSGFVPLAGLSAEISVELEENSNTVLVVFNEKTDFWPQTGVRLQLTVGVDDDFPFGDMVGHNPLPAEMPVTGLDASDPTWFVQPLTGEYRRADDDGLAVQVHWGDNVPDGEGKLSIYAGTELGGEALKVEDISDFEGALAEDDNFVDITSWAVEGKYAYTLVLEYESGGEVISLSCPFFFARTDDVQLLELVVNDGANPGQDIDQVLRTDASLSANWGDFTGAAGLPPALSFELAFAKSEAELQEADFVDVGAVYTGSNTIDLSAAEGETYLAFVRAYDENGTLLALGSSDGVEVVAVLRDTQAPKIVYLNDGPVQGVSLELTSDNTSLSFNFKATELNPGDSGIAAYEYRLLRDSAEWSADSVNRQLDAGRTGYASALVDGQAWIIGGFNGDTAQNSIYYTPLNQQGQWSPRDWELLAGAELKEPRANFAFAQLQSGDLVAIGGSGADGTLDSLEIFSMGSKTWSRLANNVLLKRSGAKVVEVAENLLWLIGGRANGEPQSSIVEIDLNSATLQVSELTGLSLSSARDNLQVAVQARANGKKYLYVLGGSLGASPDITAVATVDVFDLSTRSRINNPPVLSQARYDYALLQVPRLQEGGQLGDELWLLGGFADNLAVLSSVERIMPDGSLESGPHMISPRAQFGAAWLPESESILAVGGAMDDLGAVGNSVEQLAYGDEEWSLQPSLNRDSGLVEHSLALVGSGDQARIVAFGGLDGNYSFQSGSESRPLLEQVRGWETVTLDSPVFELEAVNGFSGLNLQNGGKYYFQLRVTDFEGNKSLLSSSKGILIDTALTRASVSSEQLPEEDYETAENSYVFNIGGEAVLSYKYRLLKDDVLVQDWSSNWIAVSNKLNLTLTETGVYVLEVIGKSASKEQLAAEPSKLAWTLLAPQALVVSGLPEEGGKTYETWATLTIAGTGLKQYDYRLNEGEWSEKLDIDAKLELTGLDYGAYKLELRGYASINAQTLPTERNWNVLEAGLQLEFSPSLPTANAEGLHISASDEFEISVKDANDPDDGDLDAYIYELWKDGVKLASAGSEATPIDIAVAIELSGLQPGDYLLKLRAHMESTDEWQSIFTEQDFRVAELGETSFTPELAMDSVDSYMVTVDLNGLSNYKYSLTWHADGGDSEFIPETIVDVQVPEDLHFALSALAPGSYTLSLWGGDGSASGVYQPSAQEHGITVTSSTPVGERLLATLETEKTLISYADDADNLTVTLGFSEKLMAAPQIADFSLSGAELLEIVETDGQTYELTLAPVFAPDADNQVLASLQLPAGLVFGYYSGMGNLLSNKLQVLFYRDSILKLSLKGESLLDDFEASGEELPEQGLKLNDSFALHIIAQAQDKFKGGDLRLFFNADKFKLLLSEDMELEEVDEDGNALLNGEAIVSEDFRLKTIAEYIYDDGDEERIIGLRLAGTNSAGVEIGDGAVFATLYFQAIGEGLAGEDDFWLEGGDSGLLLNTYGILEPESELVSYGNYELPVEFAAAQLSLSFDEDSATEGEQATLVIALSYALDYDLKVTVNGVVYTLPAQVLSQGFTVDLEDDNLLNGDRVVTYTATLVDSDEHVKSLEGAEAELFIIDDDAAKLSFTILNVDDEEISEVDEGEEFKLQVSLPEDVSVDAKLSFNISYGGTALPGNDFVLSKNLSIETGDSSGEIIVTTFADGIVDEGKTLTISVNSISLASGNASSAFVAPETIVVNINNKDVEAEIAEDINGDGIVDLDDLLALLNSWLLKEGDEGYNPACDFNNDGIVDLDDLLKLLNKWTPEEESRSAARRAAVVANVTLRMQEKYGRSQVKLGDTVTIQVFVSTDWEDGIAGGRVDVNYSPAMLGFDGVFKSSSIVKNFNTLGTQGSLDDETGKILGVGGANLDGMAYNQELLMLEFSLKANELGDGTATVSLGDRFNFATMSGGPATDNGNLEVTVLNSLSFTIVDPNADLPLPSEFALAFEIDFDNGAPPTRASEKAGLILGMREGASLGYDAGLDSQAMPTMPGAYGIAFVDDSREMPKMQFDFRDLSDGDTWHVSGTLPKGLGSASSLKLDWSLSLDGTDTDYSMPEYYRFTIVFADKTELDMRESENKFIVFANDTTASDTFSFAVKVSKAIEDEEPWEPGEPEPELLSQPCQLNTGWNLIGIPFDLQEASRMSLAYFETRDYDPDSDSFIEEITEFIPGRAYWIFVGVEDSSDGLLNLTLWGHKSEAQQVSLAKGWNLRSPLYGSELSNPTSPSIPTVWYWTSSGYRWLVPGALPQLGVGYWFYSGESGSIWPVQP